MFRTMLFTLAAVCLLGSWTSAGAQLSTDQLNKLSLEALTAPPARPAYRPPAARPAYRAPAYRAPSFRARGYRAPAYRAPAYRGRYVSSARNYRRASPVRGRIARNYSRLGRANAYRAPSRHVVTRAFHPAVHHAAPRRR